MPAWYGPGEEADAVAREYLIAREQAGLFEMPARGLLAVSGPKRQAFLQNILSNDVTSRSAGQGCAAALMDVKGHLLVLMRVLVAESEILLEVPQDRLAFLEERLVHYRVGTPVRFAARPVVALALMGPHADAVLQRAGVEVPAELGREGHVVRALAGVDARLVRAGDIPLDGWVLHVPPDASSAARGALIAAGAAPIGDRAVDVLRIEAGRPWFGIDITPENLLHETGLVAEYHSASKGCYVGQEVIARLDARGGNVNKRLVGLKLSAAATAGTTITADGRDVGRITTAGVSPRVGPIAMGYVHRSRFDPGASVTVDEHPAAIEPPARFQPS